MGAVLTAGTLEKMKLLLASALLLFLVVLPTVKGHCCGHCVPALCSCYQKAGGCDLMSADGDCDPPLNSHLCCAPQSAGDCNLFCCECSSCCSRVIIGRWWVQQHPSFAEVEGDGQKP